MKLVVFLMTGLLAFSVSATAKEKGSSAHGGGAFVCVDKSHGQYLWAKSQDLIEAQSRGLSLLFSRDDEKSLNPDQLDQKERELASQALSRLAQINPTFYNLVQQALEQKVLAKRIIRKSKLLSTANIDDQRRYLDLERCEPGVPAFVFAAIYVDGQKPQRVEQTGFLNDAIRFLHLGARTDLYQGLTYNKTVWDLFHSLDRAALDVHEAVYWVMRNIFHASNSDLTRKIVSLVFSNATDEQIRDSLPSALMDFEESQAFLATESDKLNDEYETKVLAELKKEYTQATKPTLKDFVPAPVAENEAHWRCVGYWARTTRSMKSPSHFNISFVEGLNMLYENDRRYGIYHTKKDKKRPDEVVFVGIPGYDTSLHYQFGTRFKVSKDGNLVFRITEGYKKPKDWTYGKCFAVKQN